MKDVPKLSYSDQKRFWKLVDNQISGCWTWLGYLDCDGYGNFTLKHKTYQSHRVMLSLSEGNRDLPVRHLCNNPSCVNPDHLRYGTVKENSQDSIDAGTWAHGTTQGLSKLTEEKVKQIKEMYPFKTQREIAVIMCVRNTLISQIVRGEIWKHIPGACELPVNKGSYNGRAKLIESDIPIIRKLCENHLQKDVGKLFGVNRTTISHIMTGKKWEHVPGVATDEEVAAYLV